MEVKDVLILKWGKYGDKDFIGKDIIFPKKADLKEMGFTGSDVGEAYNFRKIKEGIICDVRIYFPMNTITPFLKILKSKKEKGIRIIQKAELINLTFVQGSNIDKSLNNNLSNSISKPKV